MAWPSNLHVALKEWDIVCAALSSGRQIVLLRKGGIHEAAGEFEIDHREFLLFPTHLHQKPELVKPDLAPQVQPAQVDPAEIEISSAGQITDILRIESRRQMDQIDHLHLWSQALIDMRFNYRPQNPLYLLLVRVFRLPEVQTLLNTPAYAGCKSWVPLEQPIAIGAATPVLDDARWAHQRKLVLEGLSATAPL